MSSTTVTERTETPVVAISPARSRRKQILFTAAVAAVLVGVVYGAHWWSVGRFVEDTDDAYVGGDVTVISPKVAGYVTQLAVTDNQVVHAGDLLVKIDDRDYRAAVAKAEGAVSAQEALLVNLDANEQLQQAIISQAKAGVSAADAETNRSRDDKTRYRDLSSRAAVSMESAQRADATYKTAQANTEKAQAALIASQRQLAVIASQKLEARAALAQAKAERDIAQLNEGYTQLRAPIDGVVGNRRAHLGAYAVAGAQLLSVVPAHGLWVDANFKEDQLARMHEGQSVDIHADVMPGKVFHGHLVSLAPATGAQFSVLPPENATGNFTKVVQRVPVRIALDSKDDALGVLRPGLSVVADVNTRDNGSAHSP
jgi:membrane fusion protein (multidrug efflux system)